jgi:hypothetical protein
MALEMADDKHWDSEKRGPLWLVKCPRFVHQYYLTFNESSDAADADTLIGLVERCHCRRSA